MSADRAPLRKAVVVVKDDPDGTIAAGNEFASLATQMVEDIAGGLRVLRTRDGMHLPEDRIYERAKNIAAAILGNYVVRPMDD